MQSKNWEFVGGLVGGLDLRNAPHKVGLLSKTHKKNSALGRTRTCNPRFRRPMLYPLSYECVSRSERRPEFGQAPATDLPVLLSNITWRQLVHRSAHTFLTLLSIARVFGVRP